MTYCVLTCTVGADGGDGADGMNSGCTVLAVLADGGDGMNSGVHCRRLMEVMERMELMEVFGGDHFLAGVANFLL